MAFPTANALPETTDVDTDYGSEFSMEEEHIIHQLLLDRIPHTTALPDIEDNPIVTDIEWHHAPQTLRIPRPRAAERWSPIGEEVMEDAQHAATAMQIPVLPVDPGYPDLSRALLSIEKEDHPDNHQPTIEDEAARSPLEKFRSRPKKALSVTDLVSPAWCELQYYYNMKYPGRKKRTAAMKRGSAIHRELEDQLYTTVKVATKTKEDAWGLRIWNVIQGLNTLRETGYTRELEVWGLVHGEVVNGVIDEISYICPDPDLEEHLERRAASKKHVLRPADQPTLPDFIEATRLPLPALTPGSKESGARRVYLCDVKTRGARTLPSEIAMRSTKYQLMLYHRIFRSLATNNVDFHVLAQRFDLDVNAPFSDALIAQMGSLTEEVEYTPFEQSDPKTSALMSSSQDSITLLLSHNSFQQLWALMISTFRMVLPNGVASIGNVLKVEYRSRSTGQVMGDKTFQMDEPVLENYLDVEMQWWKGERNPVGVVIEEAFKCASCDFADSCEWRLQRVQDAIEKARKTRGRPAKDPGRVNPSEEVE